MFTDLGLPNTSLDLSEVGLLDIQVTHEGRKADRKAGRQKGRKAGRQEGRKAGRQVGR